VGKRDAHKKFSSQESEVTFMQNVPSEYYKEFANPLPSSSCEAILVTHKPVTPR
jgi:hypothetical protein